MALLQSADVRSARRRRTPAGVLFGAASVRVETRLEARNGLRVRWPGGSRELRRGERLRTEIACKYTIEGFGALQRGAGCVQTHCRTGPQRGFAVFVAR
ncbi:MAG TPA: L-histidine N(alpha)-methyltransferase [Rubrivivax sp.]|nr:L-histidine N(alpha)-methyltransferase [Rubrivivax sp.]